MVDTPESQTWKGWLEKNDESILTKYLINLHEVIWNPTAVDQQCAWEFVVQLSTRVTLQRLNYRSGTESEALDSIRELFQSTRKQIASHGIKCEHFGRLAEIVLNQIIRKFLGRWRQVQSAGNLLLQDERRLFRRGLAELQEDLFKVIPTFEALAGVASMQLSNELRNVDVVGPNLKQIWPSSFAGPPTVPEVCKSPEPDAATIKSVVVLEQELEAIERRRNERYTDCLLYTSDAADE